MPPQTRALSLVAPQLCDTPEKPGWVTTYTGRQFYPLEPSAADIAIEDIAHQLACQVRWLGATCEPYSIAQHCVHVAELVPRPDALWALLHDASEAYMADVPRPVKHLPAMEPYRAAEKDLQSVIYRRFGLRGDEPKSVKLADYSVMVAEALDLLSHVPGWLSPTVREQRDAHVPFRITPWSAAMAERAFIDKFNVLCPGRLCKCGKRRRARQRTCRDCHAAFMREYRGSGSAAYR